jgi:hypothetical protein
MTKKAKEFCRKNDIKLVGNHMIYFCDLDDFCVGVLAEDTNDFIKNMKTKEEEDEAKSNLKILKSWI